MTENKKILKATGIIAAWTLVSRILGFARDMIIANMFGAHITTDAFFIAFKIPNLLRRLLGEGALSAVFVPLFTEYMTTSSKDEAWKFANAVLTTLFFVLVSIVVFGILFMPWIITVMAPGFLQDQSKFDLAVTLTRITFPYIFFISIAAVCMGILNSLRHFSIPAFAPVLLNIALIVSALLITPFFDVPITGLAVGVLLGGGLQLILYIKAVKSRGMVFKPDFSFSHPGIKKVLKLMAPYTLSLGVTQINIFVDTLIASFLIEGSISYLYYSDRIVQLPLGVFGAAIGTAILPSLSTMTSQKNTKEISSTLSFALRFSLFVMIPATIALCVLALPITVLLFERGSFDHSAAIMTSRSIMAFSVGLFAFSGIKVITPVYFAFQDTKTPVKAAIIAMIVNIFLNLLLMGPLGHMGIALATSISAILNMILLLYFLRKKTGELDWSEITHSVLKVCLSSAIMGAICFGLNFFFYSAASSPFMQGCSLFATISAGLLVYFFSAYLLKCRELTFFLSIVQTRLKKR